MEMDVDNEDETDWRSSDIFATRANQNNALIEPSPHRVILHFDLDCFYAQVEMIRNPALRNLPLGIQQKYIIVTCNYVAREQGVTKLMSVTDAKEKCPQLVLVKGEDLTYYREISHKVTELLMTYCPMVERLGFDENFMDITEMVETRMKHGAVADLSFSGHVYNQDSLDARAKDHPRLAVGSHIAAELREAMHSKLGLTGCAGIATSKLLAKLVSGTFKPNQQTTLLPESTADMMNSLTSLRKVPGVGHRTAQRLHSLGLLNVRDLQVFPLAELVKEFRAANAQRIQSLSRGIDDAPVTPAGPPQSLSDEDSFKKMSTVTEVTKKVEDLLTSLLERMHKDGRQPLTFRLTVRRFSASNKWFNRESRQCPIPNHTGQKIISGSCDALAQLVNIAMKLFLKMIDTNAPFHLTLINVCFSNLQSKCASKGSIVSFFAQRSPRKFQTTPQQQENLSFSGSATCTSLTEGDGLWDGEDLKRASMTTLQQGTPPLPIRFNVSVFQKHPVAGCVTEGQMDTCKSQMTNILEERQSLRLPPNVDPDVFKLLPEDIQMELMCSSHVELPLDHPGQRIQSATAYDPTDPFTLNQNLPDSSQPLLCQSVSSSMKDRDDCEEPSTQTTKEGKGLAIPQASLRLSSQVECSTGKSLSLTPVTDFPSNVDPHVFSELPSEMQRELLSEWRQQKPVLKIPSKKTGKSGATSHKKSVDKSPQANNLLKYFKHS